MTSTAPDRPVLSDPTAMIEALGGPRMTAEKLGYTGKNARIMVTQWKARGVPYAWRPTMARVLYDAGYVVSRDFLEPPR